MWMAEKPSNIALIKYMGKSDVQANRPSNSSLSWTLDHLTTRVVLEKHSGPTDVWEPLTTDFPFPMSEKGKLKYLNHLDRLKKVFGVIQNFKVSSGNNFPADCGIASSASSFAALTEVAVNAFTEITGKSMALEEKAKLSALGSGSSCRSFFSGWVLWDGDGVESIDLPLQQLLHMVVIVGGGTKKVSSSEAHQRVPTSLLNRGRNERAEQRLQEFMALAKKGDWTALSQVAWQEFWDMHSLFETCTPPFGYFLPGTQQILNELRACWDASGDGPLVTMDAGPNVHLLWRPEQLNKAQTFFKESIQGQWTCLSNIEGIGFAQV